MASPDVCSYASDKHKPLLPVGPLPKQADPPLCPIYLGRIPLCLELSLADPDLFEPNLSDNNLDCTVQAYLYWRALPQKQQPPPTLMFRHFKAFLYQELQILHQQDAHLHHWHNRILGTDDHICRCNLNGLLDNFHKKSPIPT